MLIFFFIVKVLCLFFTILLIFSNQNPVYSVLHLVIVFVIGSILLLFLGIDFLPYIFIIVYAGAVAVLFLFVVIILKIKLKSGKINLLSKFVIICVSVFINIWAVPPTFLNLDRYAGQTYSVPVTKCKKACNLNLRALLERPLRSDLSPSSEDSSVGVVRNINFSLYDYPSNITNLGKILYTEYNIHFVIAGLILLVAIIGAISLTRIQSTSRKQKVYLQATRSDVVGKFYA